MQTILVVDDDPAISVIVAEALRDEGYAVAVAENGALALQKVRQIRPAVVVLDLMMPVMDGWTFLERCRADPRCAESRVLVLSAAHSSRTANLNADAFISKPFDLGTHNHVPTPTVLFDATITNHVGPQALPKP